MFCKIPAQRKLVINELEFMNVSRIFSNTIETSEFQTRIFHMEAHINKINIKKIIHIFLTYNDILFNEKNMQSYSKIN